jgi:hypothetical protein
MRPLMRVMRCLAAAAVLAALLVSGGAASASILITVDKSTQQMRVEVDGKLRWEWPVSTGRAGHDTPNGRYTAFRLERDHFSREWDDAPMPHSIFFTRAGHAIHGTNHTRQLGRPASAGCVRLAPEHAEALFALVEARGLPQTRVVIEGDLPPDRPPLVARRTPQDAPAAAASADYALRARAAIDRAREAQARRAEEEEPPQAASPRERTVRDLAPTLRAEPHPPLPPPARYAGRPRYPDHPPYEPLPRYRAPREWQQPYSSRGWGGPRVYYDPYVTVIEEYWINGRLVRRQYRRPAGPDDFRGWR